MIIRIQLKLTGEGLVAISPNLRKKRASGKPSSCETDGFLASKHSKIISEEKECICSLSCGRADYTPANSETHIPNKDLKKLYFSSYLEKQH